MTTIPGSGRSRNLALNVALWFFQILLSALFAFAGINKLLGLQQEMLDQFQRMGFGTWFRHLTGVLELTGAIGLLIPPLSGLAALGLAGVMVGAVLIHLFVIPPAAVALAPRCWAASSAGSPGTAGPAHRSGS